MLRPVHFEIMAQDPERAAKFYGTVFNWQINKWDGPAEYWLAITGTDNTPGINGAIARSQGEALTVNTIEVSAIDEMTTKVTDHGGQIVLPKIAIPGVGYLVYCKDTEGIIFGLHQPDPNAQ